MPITHFELAEEHGHVTAHVVVMRRHERTGRMGRRANVMLAFTVDGRAIGRLVATGEDGVAQARLTLQPGYHVVEVRDVEDGERGEQHIHIHEPRPEAGSGWEQAGMFAYWLIVLLLAAWLGTFRVTLTLAAIATYGVQVMAHFRRIPFWVALRNNNWVFPAVSLMLILALIVAVANPLKPEAPWTSWWNWMSGSVSLSGRGTFWGGLNWLLFGEHRTWGWAKEVPFLFCAMLAAIPVSFWDEFVNWLTGGRRAGAGHAEAAEGHGGGGGGVVRALARHIGFDLVGDLLTGRGRRRPH